MPLANGGKRGDSGHNGDGDDCVKCHGDCNEEQKSCCLVRESMRKLEASIHHKGYYLIHDFDYDDNSCPQPQPLRRQRCR